VTIRLYCQQDAPAVARLSAACARSESDFVLNPMWEDEEELAAEFARHRIAPEEHLLVAEGSGGEVLGLSGFLRPYGSEAAGMFCPIVERRERGRGLGGELLRAALDHGHRSLGIRVATAGIGTRNRSGYSLLTAHGFRPVRQHFLMRCDEKPREPELPDDVELGLAGRSDLQAILEIYHACGFDARTADELRELFEDRRHVHAVARHDGKVVAFAEVETHWLRRPWVSFVGVRDAMRDRGLGSALVAWSVARQMEEAGAKQALLLLSPANRTALRAYEKVGFRRLRLVDVLVRGL
jgi:ribosomal protein S18 acetylase RimI-like enzyme